MLNPIRQIHNLSISLLKCRITDMIHSTTSVTPDWLTLVTSLPTENATLRQRAWRALRASGAAVLRDGVYLMPSRPECAATFERLAGELNAGGGTALVLPTQQPVGQDFAALFDRSADYAVLLSGVQVARLALQPGNANESQKTVRRLRKALQSVAETDFFPGPAHSQCAQALEELAQACTRALSPDEPHAMPTAIERLAVGDFQGRVWATRARPWVDRLASAWLIARFIDPSPRFVWLESPEDCPPHALGFDFDGARFSHVDERVTFEVLIESFGLQDAGLQRLAGLIHFLDAGGVQPPEAIGVEAVLAGLRSLHADDDALLAAACAVFDALRLQLGPE
jgi:hypothetical protein